MSIVKEFKYFKPESLKEAVALLADHDNSTVLAGGTDLVAELKEDVVAPDAVIDIKGIWDMNQIVFRDGILRIGPLVTFTDLIQSRVVNEHFPILKEMAQTVASVAVRNRATVAGNICSAVPCIDSGPVLCLYDAQITVRGPVGTRNIAVKDWFRGVRQTAIKEAEIVTSIRFPLPAKSHGGCFIKLGRYSGEDLAQALVAVLALPGHQYRISFGSVAPVPLRALQMEASVNGKPLTDELIKEAQSLIAGEISPISDIRASKEYRLHMSEVMFERAIKAAVARLEGTGPAYGTALI
jgi:CO/xanthine dehydrogenase FAD-binding subunit